MKKKSKRKFRAVHSKTDIAIFSEGKAYWGTFQPVVEALIALKQHLVFYSLDVEDPGLAVESPYVQPHYIKNWFFGFHKLNRIKANVFLATTPNIGTPGYPMEKSPAVKCLIHVFHSVSDISIYKKGSLDHYDAVLLGGDFQIKSIREIEQKRKLPTKKLIAAGLPYFDTLAHEVNMVNNKKGANRQTVLVGSSWGPKGCLDAFGSGFIKQIADAGYDVIVRPHPQSYRSEQEMLDRLKEELSDYQAVEWDPNSSPSKAMANSDILISDTSSLRFDYAFLHKKPVITLEIQTENIPGFEMEDLDENWINKLSRSIGMVVTEDEIGSLPNVISRALLDFNAAEMEIIRDRTIHNFGKSGVVIASLLIQENDLLRG